MRKKRITHKNTNTKEEEKAKSAKTKDIIGSLPLFWSILAHHKVLHSKLISEVHWREARYNHKGKDHVTIRK